MYPLFRHASYPSHCVQRLRAPVKLHVPVMFSSFSLRSISAPIRGSGAVSFSPPRPRHRLRWRSSLGAWARHRCRARRSSSWQWPASARPFPGTWVAAGRRLRHRPATTSGSHACVRGSRTSTRRRSDVVRCVGSGQRIGSLPRTGSRQPDARASPSGTTEQPLLARLLFFAASRVGKASLKLQRRTPGRFWL